MWFAGAHSDVGGRYDERGLSNLALQWMPGKARGCGLHVDADALGSPAHRGDPLGTMHESFEGFRRFRGRRRRVPPRGARIHRSVVARMRDEASRYTPRLPKDYVVVD